jgi:RNA polymerase sigma-70 factor (ECF subfamily)
VTARCTDIPAEVIDRAREGDRAALARLAELAYPRVRRWALVQLGSASDADDLTQDVIIKMIRKVHGFRGNADFQTWLYALTRNGARDVHRARRRRSESEQHPRLIATLVPDGPPDPDEAVERGEARQVLMEAFQTLPTRQREVYDLVELQGLGAARAAELLGIAPVSVRAHLFKARRSMREVILREHAGVLGGSP